jgi:hypothetical protein
VPPSTVQPGIDEAPMPIMPEEAPELDFQAQAPSAAPQARFASTQSRAAAAPRGEGLTMFGDAFTLYRAQAAASRTSLSGDAITINGPPGNMGGAAGYRKIAEDASPFPVDRLIFNYDYYDNTTLTPSGLDVSQFTLGVEKTFLDQNMSIEAKLPMAASLDSSQDEYVVMNGSSNNPINDRGFALGNLQVTLKALLYTSQDLHFSGGLGVTLPTAEDNEQFGTFDTGMGTYLRVPTTLVENETIMLQPYLAMAWTPNPRLFSTTFVQGNYDTVGNSVSFNTTGSGLQDAGTIQAPSLLHISTQIGYWLHRDPCNRTGFAPFVELHYNTTTSDEDLVTQDAGGAEFSAGYYGNRIDELNITGGFLAELGPRWNVAGGLVLPLKSEESLDRSFDYQLGLRVNWFYGATARDRGL